MLLSREMIGIFMPGSFLVEVGLGFGMGAVCRLETWEENPTVSAESGWWGLVQTDGDLWGTSLTNTLLRKILGASQMGDTQWVEDLPRAPPEWRLPRVIIPKVIL